MQQKEKLIKIVVIIYFFLYVITTVFIEKDYGWSVDDLAQRDHSLVAYKYVNEIFFNRDLSTKEPFEGLPDIHDYSYRYYGVALQLPFVLIEDMNGFELDWSRIFHIRHMGSALICAAGYFFLYLLIKGITKRRDMGFLGLLMISLYPRFFGERFINIKDQVFVATCCLAFYGIYLYLENDRKPIYGVVAGLTAAIATFSRNVGFLFPAVLLGYMIVSDIFLGRFKNIAGETGLRKYSWLWRARDYCVVAFSYLFIWYLGTPVAWFRNPVKEYYASFKFFSVYGVWNGTSLFYGKNLRWKEYPWYYLPVWIGITVPLVYLVLFLIGHLRIVHKKESFLEWIRRMLDEDKYLSFALVMFWGPSFLVACHIIKIYNSWRHMYFIMCPLIVIAVYGWLWLEEVFKKRNIKRVLAGVVALSFVSQTSWMVINHPYEYAFFNIIGRPIASQFDRDYFRGCEYDLLKYILSHDDRDKLTIGFPDSDISMLLIPWEERSHVTATFDWDGDYILVCYLGIAGNEYHIDGYEEDYYIAVDGYKLGSVFKKTQKGVSGL